MDGVDEGAPARAAERRGDNEEAESAPEVRKPEKPSPTAGAVRRPAPPGGAAGGGKAADAPTGAGAKEKEPKDLMKMIVQQNKKQAAANADTSAIVVGTASCGKSTLLKGLLNKDEEPKATLALEYSFVRPKATESGRKDVAHIWEIGGGTAMQNLLDVPLTESTVKTATVVIVADLSKPEEVFVGVSYWLERLRARLQDIDKVLKSKEATAKVMDQLKERSAKRFDLLRQQKGDQAEGGDKPAEKQSQERHPDYKFIKHTGVNVAIVATKWDMFEKKDSELKKIMGRCLRFLAHSNGASLIYCGKGEKVLVDKFRLLLNHFLFKGPPLKSREVSTNHLRPLLVPAGADTFKVRLDEQLCSDVQKKVCRA